MFFSFHSMRIMLNVYIVERLNCYTVHVPVNVWDVLLPNLLLALKIDMLSQMLAIELYSFMKFCTGLLRLQIALLVYIYVNNNSHLQILLLIKIMTDQIYRVCVLIYLLQSCWIWQIMIARTPLSTTR